MAKEQKLIPNRERTPSELREIARKGGIASGEARRKKKAIQEVMDAIDEMPMTSQTITEIAERLGAPEEWIAQMTQREAKAFSVNKTILMKGDVKDWVEWLKVKGEYTPTQRVISSSDPLDDDDFDCE